MQYGRRDQIAVLCTTVLPVVMLFCGLCLLKYGESGSVFANQPPRRLVRDHTVYTANVDCHTTRRP